MRGGEEEAEAMAVAVEGWVGRSRGGGRGGGGDQA